MNDAMDLSFTTDLKYLFMLMKTWFREVLYYWLHHEFLSTFKIAAFSFLKFYRQAKNWENMQKNKDTWGKIPKRVWNYFWVFFWVQNEDPSNDPCPDVLAEVGVVLTYGVGERKKKRDTETERAFDGTKKYDNCWPSLPVSILTPGESLAQIWVARWHIEEDLALFILTAFFGAVWWCRAAKTSLKYDKSRLKILVYICIFLENSFGAFFCHAQKLVAHLVYNVFEK